MKVLILLAACAAPMLFSAPALAALEIQMADGCPVGVVDTSPQPNCPEDAACRSRGDTVQWRRADGGQDFAIRIVASSIFDQWGQGSCQSPAGPSGQILCRISDDAPAGDYKYDVEADGCVLDPRLVVR